jgi:hypothetical protein
MSLFQFSEEEFKREESEDLRRIFGGVTLLHSSPSESYQDSSDLEEDDGMIFNTKAFKLKSFEERKEILDREHQIYNSKLKEIQITSLWDFKCPQFNN